ncbi:hypothetical protein ABEB36_013604 [Hypothenemus hampei]|uniref:Uncharacterized protein n=1 Tax=Hypothenemus hampei TaxID=57062 RepID=A0ABD1E6V1_HYPHA
MGNTTRFFNCFNHAVWHALDEASERLQGDATPSISNRRFQLLNVVKLPTVGVHISNKDTPEVLNGVKVGGYGRIVEKTDIPVTKPRHCRRTYVDGGVVLLKNEADRWKTRCVRQKLVIQDLLISV